ncbi:carbohydrate-binding protein, partial [Bacillus thuringiensis]|uniref:carbohydrate-binding protein n=1 Tax=Bacillus thuringiensis TaxID=1428 RepID=UPI002FFE08E2
KPGEKPSEKPEGSWNSEKTYNGGAKVTYKDVTYQAKWWTKGDMPGRSDVWERLGEQITIEPWKKGFGYKGGEKVTFEGVTYQAKWWTNSDIPGKSDVWEKIS